MTNRIKNRVLDWLADGGLILVFIALLLGASFMLYTSLSSIANKQQRCYDVGGTHYSIITGTCIRDERVTVIPLAGE